MRHRNYPTRLSLAAMLMSSVYLVACGGAGEGETSAQEGPTETAESLAGEGETSAQETSAQEGPTETAESLSSYTWSKVADQGQTFTLASWTWVRYGSGKNWVYKRVSGTVSCTNEFFGNPAPGVRKACDASVAPRPTLRRLPPPPAPPPPPPPPELPVQRLERVDDADHAAGFGPERGRARRQVHDEHRRLHHRRSLLQGDGQHRHPCRQPLERRRRAARAGHLQRRDGVGLAAGELCEPGPGEREHSLCRVVLRTERELCGRPQLLRHERRQQRPGQPAQQRRRRRQRRLPLLEHDDVPVLDLQRDELLGRPRLQRHRHCAASAASRRLRPPARQP